MQISFLALFLLPLLASLIILSICAAVILFSKNKRPQQAIKLPLKSNVNNEEVERILSMVQDHKISPEEGVELLDAMESSSKAVKCPFCAEQVVLNSGICPECDSVLYGDQDYNASESQGFRSLGAISKFLIIYMLLIGAIVICFNWTVPMRNIVIAMWTSKLVAVIGITAAILMLKKNKAGWYLGIVWSFLQVVTIYISYTCLNKQVFYVGIHTLTNGNGFGLNLVGVALIILFIAARKEWICDDNSKYPENILK